MTWINFLSFLGMGYAAYYLLIILLDSRPAPSKTNNEDNILTFSETVVPEKVALEDIPLAVPASSTTGPASTGLGGVSLKGMFDLARQDAIQYTRSVSFDR